jgi:hypothetical protein
MITSLVRGAKSATAGCFEEHRPSDHYSSGRSAASNFGYFQVSKRDLSPGMSARGKALEC